MQIMSRCVQSFAFGLTSVHRETPRKTTILSGLSRGKSHGRKDSPPVGQRRVDRRAQGMHSG